MIFLHFYLGFCILISGCDLAAMSGRFTRELDLVGSGIVPAVPWIGVVAYTTLVLLTRKHTKWKRGCAIGMAFVVAMGIASYPMWLLENGVERIHVGRHFGSAERTAFKAKYGVPVVFYSSSVDGACLLVPKNRYSNDMAEFVARVVMERAK